MSTPDAKTDFCEELERRINRFYGVCEKIVVRSIVFACFVYEVGKFVSWLFWGI